MTTMHHAPPGTTRSRARRATARPAAADPAAAAAAVVDAIEEERASLAGALHDGVVQGLVAARLAVDIAERRGADPAQLAPVRAALAGAMRDARATLWSLRARGRCGDVAAALVALAEHFHDHGGPALEVHGASVADGVSRIAGVLAYRVVQQVATQAGSGTVSVDVSRTATGCVRLVICAASLDEAPGTPLTRVLDQVVRCGGTVLPVPAGLVVSIPSAEEAA